MRAGPAADVLHLGLGKLPRARGTFSPQWDKKAESGAEQIKAQPTPPHLCPACVRAAHLAAAAVEFHGSAPLLQEKGWQEQSEEG